MASTNVDWKPEVGMGFDNMEEAKQFWLAYGLRVGFGIRVRFTNKKKNDSVTSCRFVCCKEGLKNTGNKNAYEGKYERADIRTNCLARITLSRCKNEKLVIHEFLDEHNHELQNPKTTHMLRSHRKITEVQAYKIDMANDSGLRQKSTFQLMSTHAGHRANVGFTEKDVRNYITAKRKRSMAYGEIGCLSQYFQRQLLENPSFFHAYQMDAEE